MMQKDIAEQKAWSDFSDDEYCDVLAKFVHFSFKTVNSNATGGGIRLSQDDTLSLPYVSVRTMMNTNPEFDWDYTRNSGTPAPATVLKQWQAIKTGSAPSDKTISEELKRTVSAVTATRFEEGTHTVSPRLKQVLLPRDGSYVAITPLGAGGLSRLLHTRVQAHNELANIEYENKHIAEQDKHMRKLYYCHLGIGGGKTQNVGGLARQMQESLYFEAPTQNKQLREALSIHFKGISLKPSPSLMQEYFTWLKQYRALTQQFPNTQRNIRDEERSKVQSIVRQVLYRGIIAKQTLEEFRHLLPDAGKELLSTSLDELMQGLIDPKQRTHQWSKRFASKMADIIADYKFDAVGTTLNFSDSAKSKIAQWIEESI